jgi:hypothetical protein
MDSFPPDVRQRDGDARRLSPPRRHELRRHRGKFILGQSSSASSKSTLSAPLADKALTVTNNSTQAGATVLGLNVAKGHPPFRVNSGARVANLNADQVDGLDGSNGFGLVHLGTDPRADGGVVI